MSVKRIFAYLISVFLFAVFFSHIANAASYEITVNSGSSSPGNGSFSTSTINATVGEVVTINFSVPSNDPYCCGLYVKGNGNQFNTGTIGKGTSKQINFTATSSFTFSAYWPATSTLKATGSVNVAAAPIATPTHTVAPSNTPTSAPTVPGSTSLPTNTPLPTNQVTSLPETGGSTTTTPTPSVAATTVPIVPTNIVAKAISSSQIELSWDVADGATGYEIYRNAVLLTEVSSLTYSDQDLLPQTEYTYTIKAINNLGSSALSVAGKATTLATEAGGDEPFIDETQSYVSVNGIIYPYTTIPEFDPGSVVVVYGRTSAGALVEITVRSEPQNYSVISDANGKWHISFSTKTLEKGVHTFEIGITAKESTTKNSFDPISFTVGVTPPPNNSGIFIGGGLLIIGLVLVMSSLYLFLRSITREGYKYTYK